MVHNRLRKRKGIKIVKAKNTKHLIDAMVGKIRKEDDHLSNLSILNAHLEASDKELLELERLAEIGKALERATKIGTAWVFVESIGECTYPSEEEIQSLVLWYRECNKEFYAI